MANIRRLSKESTKAVELSGLDLDGSKPDTKLTLEEVWGEDVNNDHHRFLEVDQAGRIDPYEG